MDSSETNSTLLYANQARNIKNRVSVNKQFDELAVLRQENLALKRTIASLRETLKNLGAGGIGATSSCVFSLLVHSFIFLEN
jgi:hypothetical protein